MFIFQFSHSVVSDSLQPHGLQHTMPPCSSPTSRAYSNSCPSHWWCHPTISSSVVPFSCLRSLPASGSFPMSWLLVSGGQNTRASVSASVLPINIQDWFPLQLTGLVSLQSKGLSKLSFFFLGSPWGVEVSFSFFFLLSFLYSPTLTSIHDHWKNHSFD